ncbi:GspE/PulE family protein [Roseateles depolymerans]|uniref:ATPase PulE/Tfp pilus assembly pathway n=1 Tax=Roseateles depolymerans TaxID=76731 RepID=A0A0U3CDK8_9BURK|nr:ATPase, T2SS/T4P/T4SS family [Roseateles depolymerans]ALV06808.1 ATPase PulE/Tfp pilus assembly pathway [Roseateles depolymerans]REG19786.1 type II secretory ATPase GspE/PulE/Tfp pilus assembly ATPase PilB-like protein [Roseateles depolymerans]
MSADAPPLAGNTGATEATRSAPRASTLSSSTSNAPDGSAASAAAPSSHPGSTRHLTDYAQLPPFDRVLSVVSDNVMGGRDERQVRVSRDKENKLMALALPAQRFLVLSTEDELRSPDWYHVVQAGKRLGYDFQGFYTASPDIFELITYRSQRRDVGGSEGESARAIETMVANSSPLEWFRTVIHRCVLAGASDLHLELRGEIGRARVRLDGLMRTLGSFPARIVMDGISAAYTVLAEENSRSEVAFNGGVPQAAMIPLDLPDMRLTLRYQSHPAVGGMDVVMRILRSNNAARMQQLTLDNLGFTPWQVERLHDALSSAWGGIFVAGITGSGKTTTLNTMLAHLAQEGTRKLITIEDPVEYELAGASHLSIQRGALEAVGGTNPFHGAMLSFLRMDPDVGLFGEIRDSLSANMAQVAIQTGHKILSTVHATSALGVVSRLNSHIVGLQRDDLCSPEFMSALVYQVLVPLNCDHCKVPARRLMSPEALNVYVEGFGLDADHIFCASDRGCPHCQKPLIDYSTGERNGTRGMKVGAEVIVPDLRLLELLLERRDLEARRYWRSRQKAPFTDPDMDGKEAWGHVLYDLSQGRVDPFYFERTFGRASLLAQSLL